MGYNGKKKGEECKMYRYFSEVTKLMSDMLEGDKEKTIVFYKRRIEKFFSEYMSREENREKPINAITYYDVGTYLKELKFKPSEKVNCYNALKRFFIYTYMNGATKEIMSNVEKPVYNRKEPQTITDEDYIKLVKFVTDRDNTIKERVALGIFLFTGLSRKYIASLKNSSFIYENGLYYLMIWEENGEIKLPLKAELQIIINEYLSGISESEKKNKLFAIEENGISTVISNICKKANVRNVTPTKLSNTFIKKALANGNKIDEVSKLTLESVSTIQKHVSINNQLLLNQTSILNSF
ncbi:hypothetical protein [Bacteroides sp. Phil13]|uniref:tyrosine-type recombinase/integrase n=1 Tax=Bacteroides sp. Phil13 TaxID=1929999 RepID=UPI00257FF3CC|nr:hypothetical protein [Bacteroides sp. Phil13]